jgi:hypothetical protein
MSGRICVGFRGLFKLRTIRAMRGAAAILIGVLGAAGCAGSSMPRGLDSPDPGERGRALADPALMGDDSTIPSRIEALESDDPLVRMLAIRSLERMTGRTLGYDHASEEWEREDAVARWRAWYERERAGVAGSASESEEP